MIRKAQISFRVWASLRITGEIQGIIKKHLEASKKSRVEISLIEFSIQFKTKKRRGGMPEFGGFWRNIWGIIGADLEDIGMNFGGNL